MGGELKSEGGGGGGGGGCRTKEVPLSYIQCITLTAMALGSKVSTESQNRY